MNDIGRNDPCPCGSGKKYKRCCALLREPEPRAPSAQDRSSAFRGLLRFSLAPEFKAALADGERAFWGGALDELDPRQRRELERMDQVEIGLRLYSLLDLEIDADLSIADIYLERRGSGLDPGAQRLLETLARSRLSVYEVREVAVDEGLRLRDTFRGGEVWVSERSVTRFLSRWDVLVTRVTSWPGDHRALEGDVWVFSPDRGPALLELLHAERDRMREIDPELTDERFLRELAPIVNPLWIRRMAFPPPPTLQNTDGDDLVLTELRYQVADPARLAAALEGVASIEALDPEPDREEAGIEQREASGAREWIWFAERRTDERVHLGRLQLAGNELTVEVNSREREGRVRALLADLGAGLAEPTHLERSDPREKLLRAPSRGRRGPKRPAADLGLDPAEEAAVVREFLDRHYHAWLDESIPMLGGLTPRQAAAEPKQREQLVALLKQLERAEERRPQTAGEPYDVAWIWAELGVEA